MLKSFLHPFPLTLYGYNGTSKKSVVVSSNGGAITVKTTFKTVKVNGYLRYVVVDDTITYFYAVDCYGYMLYIDLQACDTGSPFPITAIYPDGTNGHINFTYQSNTCDDISDIGYDLGYNNGYSAGYEDGSEEGTQRGYDYGYGVGYNDGYTEGYTEGYTNGENLTQSQVITNPITAFLQPVHEFMNTKFFGNLSYASLFNVVLFVVVALIFLKMFSGG